MIARIQAWWRMAFGRAGAEREMREEMAEHLARATERLMARGLSREDAKRAARREFGNVGVIQEESRDARGGQWIETTIRDFRFAARGLRRTPVFTAVVILSLALGIGANTAVFGIIYSLMLERLPIARPTELVALRRTNAAGGTIEGFFDAEYRALASAPGVSVAAFTGSGARPVFIAGAEARDLGEMIAVDERYFALLGIRPSAGRFLTAADADARAPVVVFSYDLAVRYFGSPSAALGAPITLNRTTFTIVGVAPKGFRGLGVAGSLAMAMPLRTAMQLLMPRERVERGVSLTVVARASQPTATEAALDRAFQQCCAAGQLSPTAGGRTPSRGEHVTLVDVSRGVPPPKADARAEYSRMLYVLMGGVAVLLLTACANVGTLLLARAAARRRELAVRLSLGASRGRIARQLLVESLELALAGAVAGVLLAIWGTAALAMHLPANLARLDGVVAVRPTLTVFSFAAATAVLCTLLFGLFPVLRTKHLDPVIGLREGGFGPKRRVAMLERGIVAAQVALALVLLCSAGLLAATLRNLQSDAGGPDSAHMLIADTEVRGTPYAAGGIRPLHAEMLRRVRAIPGIVAAGMATRIPLAYAAGSPDEVVINGYTPAADEDRSADFLSATPGYLEGAGIALRRGRGISDADASTAARIAVVSESFVRKFFPDRDPIGLTFRASSELHDAGDVTIVGVVADMKYYDLHAPVQPTVYVPFAQSRDWGFLSLAAKTKGPPAALTQSVRAAFTSAAPGITIRWVQPMSSMVELRLAREQALASLAGLFSLLAVVVAAVGMYGVQSYQVSERTSEIGVRVALGADTGRVVWMVLRQSLVLLAMGLAAGIPLAIAGARAIGAQLYGVAPWEPSTLAGAVGVLAGVAVVASLFPAGRAARVDPLIAIRAE